MWTSAWSQPETYHSVLYDEATTIYNLDSSHRRGFGLTENVEILRIYPRKMFHTQMRFLAEVLNDNTTEAWIYGEFAFR